MVKINHPFIYSLFFNLMKIGSTINISLYNGTCNYKLSITINSPSILDHKENICPICNVPATHKECRLPPQITTRLSSVLYPYSNTFEENFPEGHPSQNYSTDHHQAFQCALSLLEHFRGKLPRRSPIPELLQGKHA
ncbi:hypothetical protein VIGAN_09074400 [Vigna angularis var. angularis]|uniref:Uncharacterized protein n=1 Tax=Vigna angularis var. angularis TaxID=157739 RepID=A0A0S3SWV0_PHAAN|nr:hypothetical protein VIGAN_09074400 [Vigna angularis var. angularis]